MTRKGRRLVLIGSALGVAAVALSLVLFALRDSIVFFYSPAEVAQKGLGRALACGSAGWLNKGHSSVWAEAKSASR